MVTSFRFGTVSRFCRIFHDLFQVFHDRLRLKIFRNEIIREFICHLIKYLPIGFRKASRFVQFGSWRQIKDSDRIFKKQNTKPGY